jgi:hypothetical protein
MPCYGFQLRLFTANPAIPLSNTNTVGCHGKILIQVSVLSLIFFVGAQNASPQLSSAPAAPAPAASTTPTASSAPAETPAPETQNLATQSLATVDRPDFSIHVARPDAPPPGEEIVSADVQETEGGVHHLKGFAVVELHGSTFKADEVDFDENTHIFKARGHVYYRNYDAERNHLLRRARSTTPRPSAERSIMVRGYAKTKVVARPGVLTTQAALLLSKATWADKIEDHYFLLRRIHYRLHHSESLVDAEQRSLFDIMSRRPRHRSHKATYHLAKHTPVLFPLFL